MNRRFYLFGALAAGAIGACATLPDVKFTKFSFPKESVFVGDVERPYKEMGNVKAKVNFQTLDPNHDEKEICKNYYNRAAMDLLDKAKARGAQAVIKVQSVTFLNNGKVETADTPECFDDGEEGQILLQGVAVKWEAKRSKHYPAKVKVEEVSVAPTASPSPQNSASAGGVVDQPSHIGGGELAIPRADGILPVEPAPAPSPVESVSGAASDVRVGDDPSSAVQIRMDDKDSFTQPITAGGSARAGKPGTVPTQVPVEGAITRQKSQGHPGDPTH